MSLTEEHGSFDNGMLNGFIPKDYVFTDRGAYVNLILGPTEAPQDTFISHTEQRLKNAGSRQVLVPLSAVRGDASVASIAGLLFHSGRCGSTLLCNMLETNPACFVVRESEVLNKSIHDAVLTSAQKASLLRGLLGCYARYAESIGARCIIKFSSHCAERLVEILQMLPSLPWLYLHRQPSAVLASFLREPTAWMDSASLRGHSSDAVSRMLQRSYAQVQAASVESLQGRLVSYEQLVAEALITNERVLKHFGFVAPTLQSTDIKQCLLEDAKTRLPRAKTDDASAGQALKIREGVSVPKALRDNYLRLVAYG